jgi:hypothetical protein
MTEKSNESLIAEVRAQHKEISGYGPDENNTLTTTSVCEVCQDHWMNGSRPMPFHLRWPCVAAELADRLEVADNKRCTCGLKNALSSPN